jgi:WD40 repeat protein
LKAFKECYMPHNADSFESILQEIIVREEQGEKPSLKDYAESFPELADRLKEFFQNRHWFAKEAERLAPIAEPGQRRSGANGNGAPSALAPGSTFAGLEIVKLLGRGGMGEVYLGWQAKEERLVALKVMREDRMATLSEKERLKWVRGFREEARKIASLDQPDQFVTLYQIGEWRPNKTAVKVPFYTMRFMEGGSLAEATKQRRSKLGTREHQDWAARTVMAIAQAMHRAHQKKIKHLDLKPANILLDAEGRPLVTDFGLARRDDETGSLVPTGIAGTAPYMAPEQVNQGELTARTDVYSLGAILYELLTGRPPFEGDSTVEILLQVTDVTPVPPRRIESRLNRDLQTICLKCLEKFPDLRYASAQDLADDLARWQANKPIKARPVGPIGHAYRWCRRNPALAATSAAGLVAVILSGSIYSLYEATRHDVEVAQGDNDELKKDNEKLKSANEIKENANAITLVPELIRGGEIEDAKKTLAKWKPALKDDQDPPFEKSFLDRQLLSQPFSVHQHRANVVAITFSPDATQLASADQDGLIFLWDRATNKRLGDFRIKKGSIYALAWSPDGKTLAVASGEAAVNLALPRPVNPVPNGGLPLPPNGLPGLPALPNGKQAKDKGPAKGTATKLEVKPSTPAQIQFFDLGTRQDSLLNLKGKIAFQPGRTHLAWSPKGDRLAIAGHDGAIMVAQAGAAKESRILRGHSAGVQSVAWNPDGTGLASLSDDGVVKTWDVVKGKEALSWSLPGGTNNLPMWVLESSSTRWALAWTADGKVIRAVGPNNQLMSWDAANGQANAPGRLAPKDFGWLPSGTASFVWRSDGALFASVFGREIRIWDGATGQQLESFAVREDQGLPPLYQCEPAWDHEGRWIALGGGDGLVKAWPVGLKRPAVRSPVPNAQGWTHDGKGLLCIPWSPVGVIPGLVHTPEMDEAFEAIKRAAQSGGLTPPDPKAIVGGPGGSRGRPGMPAGPEPRVQLQVSDAVTGEVVRTYAKQLLSLDAKAASPDGKWIATASHSGVLQLWPVNEKEPAISLKEAGPARPNRIGPSQFALIAWSPDSAQVAFWAPGDDAIGVWEIASRRLLQTLDEKENPLRCIAFCPDGQRLASAGEQGLIKIWDIAGGKTTSTFSWYYDKYGGNRGMAMNASSMLAWSPDAKYLAIAGEDEKVQIRDVDKDENLPALPGRRAPKGFIEILCAVAWSPNGKRLAASSPDGTFIVYDTATWREVTVLRLPTTGPMQQRMPGGGGSLAWSPDGRQLAFFGGSVAIWDGTPIENDAK